MKDSFYSVTWWSFTGKCFMCPLGLYLRKKHYLKQKKKNFFLGSEGRNESWSVVLVKYAITRGLNLATDDDKAISHRAQLNASASMDLMTARCHIKHGLSLSAVTKVIIIVSVQMSSSGSMLMLQFSQQRLMWSSNGFTMKLKPQDGKDHAAVSPDEATLCLAADFFFQGCSDREDCKDMHVWCLIG